MDNINQLQHLPGETWPIPYTEEIAKENIIQSQRYCEEQRESLNFSVSKLNLPIIKEDLNEENTRLIGAILIRPCKFFDYSHENVEIGYVMDQNYHGKGIMTNCLRSFLEYISKRFNFSLQIGRLNLKIELKIFLFELQTSPKIG